MKRGCKELDEIIGNFAKNHIEHFTYLELVEYEKVLDIADHDLYHIITTQDMSTNPILMKIISFYNMSLLVK
ncbi:Sdh5 superfamily succinate dehydrogenase assembly factor 2 [Candidatus Cyrtobacter comes]|uniref:FAD assembly factor SdhE n=2 Tax=Candidatus Cyrtobacter comes TaxID=675776 RepID=A0ABU5L8T8_9RICK|nr:Sdh5 superfamily succinate dehydrogenase assembly factor 2 [Candidatus Cyrtobacter comes]